MSLQKQENSELDKDFAIRNPQSTIVVLTTTEIPEQAERIAQVLVECELAACVQILPPMTSMYRWQSKVEKATETLLLIKTTLEIYPALESAIKANHPYETPEIIALPIVTGSADYLNWLSNSIKA